MAVFFRIYICLLIAGGIAFTNLHAQNAQHAYELISVPQGLPGQFVHSVMQDSKGFIWVATGNGLVKFDGYEFHTYQVDPDDTSSLPKNQVGKLFEDSKGYIWIGTSEYSCRFDPLTEKFLRLMPTAENPAAFKYGQNFNEDADGNIWVAGEFKGELRTINQETGIFSAKNYAKDLGVITDKSSEFFTGFRCIFTDRKGIMWVGTDNGLFELNREKVKTPSTPEYHFKGYQHDPSNNQSIASNWVQTIFESSDSVLWILTGDRGLDCFDRRKKVFKHYGQPPGKEMNINRSHIDNIAEDRKGNLWIVTHDGPVIFNTVNRRYVDDSVQKALVPSVPGVNFHSILIDNSGIFWFGTSRGLLKVDHNRNNFGIVNQITEESKTESLNNVIAIAEETPGRIWIGTFNQGLIVWDKNSGEYERIRFEQYGTNGLTSNLVSAILRDKKGRMWVANGETISLFDPDTGGFNHKTLEHDFLRNEAISSVFTICEDRQGTFWLGTSNGYIRFNPDSGTIRKFPFDPGSKASVSDWWVLNILEDHLGNIWFGLGSKALNKMDPRTGKITQYEYNQYKQGTVSSNSGTSMYQDSKNNLWIGTLDGGLCRFDFQKDSFVHYTKTHGLSGNSIYSILEDKDGFLWLSTENGLSKFSYPDLEVLNFNMHDGLQSNDFAGNSSESAGLKGSDGTLYFGGAYGLNAFRPETIHLNDFLPPVVLTGFSIFNTKIAGSSELKEITLKPDENFFSFQFSALNYSNSSGNQYAYQLVGFDKEWIQSGTKREAVYTNVPPGDYTFRVKGSNNSGLWNENGISIKVTVLKPWWQTPLAYTLYIVAGAVLLFWLYNRQRKEVIRKEKEKAHLKEVEHAREIEKAYTELKSTQQQLIQSEKMASLGELTAGIAHEIQNPLNFMNNFSDVNKDLLMELKEEIDKGNFDDAKLIADDLISNEEKINHHGQRADSIVKGMLQHSRKSTGEKEPTDINALADEYLRLAFHGMRARDKSFNATLKTDFDPSIGKINLVSQDIARVLLNLYNNAFQSVAEKAKNNSIFSPEVFVMTKRMNGQLHITVKDNGVGISEKVIGKIFQPFFTTKPTGQGTGLGLSLAYDAVKSHGGEINARNPDEGGAEFTIILPLGT